MAKDNNEFFGIMHAFVVAILVPVIVLPLAILSGFLGRAWTASGILLMLGAAGLHVLEIRTAKQIDRPMAIAAILFNVAALLVELWLGFGLIRLLIDPIQYRAW